MHALRARSIAVRPAASFPGLGPGHIRLTARAPAENATLVAATPRERDRRVQALLRRLRLPSEDARPIRR